MDRLLDLVRVAVAAGAVLFWSALLASWVAAWWRARRRARQGKRR